MIERRAFAGERFEMPVNRQAKAQVAQAEQIEAPAPRPFGALNDCLTLRREAFGHQRRDGFAVLERRQEGV